MYEEEPARNSMVLKILFVAIVLCCRMKNAIYFINLLHTGNIFCIVGAFTNIEKSPTQTARPRLATSRFSKYLFHAGIAPATRNATVNRSVTASTAK